MQNEIVSLNVTHLSELKHNVALVVWRRCAACCDLFVLGPPQLVNGKNKVEDGSGGVGLGLGATARPSTDCRLDNKDSSKRKCHHMYNYPAY